MSSWLLSVSALLIGVSVSSLTDAFLTFFPFLASDHFTYMCAIDAATVKWSEVQFRSKAIWVSSSSYPFGCILIYSIHICSLDRKSVV